MGINQCLSASIRHVGHCEAVAHRHIWLHEKQNMGDPSECNIKVVCRFRPQSEAENKAGGQVVVKFPANETVIHCVSNILLHTFLNFGF